MQSSLKPPAVACKLFASIEAIAVAWFMIGYCYYDLHSATPPRDAPLDWGTPAYRYRMYLRIAAVAAVALLVAIPNRWLVFSRLLFSIALIVSLSPFLFALVLIIETLSPGGDFMGAYLLFFMLLLSALWPVSLCLSFWRVRKGERFLYA